MKLLIVVICLISERFLVHQYSSQRFRWFPSYFQQLQTKLSNRSPWLLLAIIILPWIILTGFCSYLLSTVAFGVPELFFSLIVFYYCLGPENAFYPVFNSAVENTQTDISEYFVMANQQLFAVIFWYIILGPVGAITYRLLALCCQQQKIQSQAQWLFNVFDWLPSRMTALLYLLVGHFQAAYQDYVKYFFTSPTNNHVMVQQCGLRAFNSTTPQEVAIPQAERFIEHALILFLVLIALLAFKYG